LVKPHLMFKLLQCFGVPCGHHILVTRPNKYIWH